MRLSDHILRGNKGTLPMSMHVLLVGAHPHRPHGLRRLSRMIEQAWRESGAQVTTITAPDSLSRRMPWLGADRGLAALESAAWVGGRLWRHHESVDLVHVIDPRDALWAGALPGAVPLTITCHDVSALLAGLGSGNTPAVDRRTSPDRRGSADRRNQDVEGVGQRRTGDHPETDGEARSGSSRDRRQVDADRRAGDRRASADRRAADRRDAPRVGTVDRLSAQLVLKALHRADHLIATSWATAEAVNALTGLMPTVLHPAVDPGLLPQSRRAGHLAPAWPYLLTVAGAGWRDRRPATIRAWANLRRTRPLDGSSLVIVGEPLSKDEEGLVATCGGHLEVMTDISDEQLGALYQGSQAVLALGREGGFAWPVAEAHRAGKSVLATDAASFQEVGADGCVYLPAEGMDQFNPQTWTAIAEDLTAPLVSARARANGRRFSWESFATQLPGAAVPMRAGQRRAAVSVDVRTPSSGPATGPTAISATGVATGPTTAPGAAPAAAWVGLPQPSPAQTPVPFLDLVAAERDRTRH